MRLVDADDLVIEILTRSLCGDDNVDRAIIDAPTVEAIPVEWIENRIKQLSDIANGFDKASLSYFLSNVKLDTLKDMLKEWEEENERH